ncbi:MAG: hypothetical protein JNL85_08795 [Rubrivivax sp.]|nr:hypothetical protein [Rubrivivax sp.]
MGISLGGTTGLQDGSAAARPAVAIPLYKPGLTAAEKLSIDRTVDVLVDRALFLVGPAKLESYLAGVCSRYAQRLRYKTFEDRFFAGIKGYNALMRSKDFYRSFGDHSHVLVAQTDALVLSDQLDLWCAREYSYIGAPWFAGGSVPRQPLEFLGVGNGGFSLRRVGDFLRVLETPRRIPNFIKSRSGGEAGLSNLVRRIKHERWFAYNVEPLFPTSNEDAFWGLLVPAVCPFFRVPGPEDAIAFAFEVAPRLLYEMNGHRLPFGCHAWERCDRPFWEEQLPFLRTLAAQAGEAERPG